MNRTTGIVEKVAAAIADLEIRGDAIVIALMPRDFEALNRLMAYHPCDDICTLGELRVLAGAARKAKDDSVA